MGNAEDVHLICSVPISSKALEDVGQLVNALNESLAAGGWWTELIGEEDNAYVALLKLGFRARPAKNLGAAESPPLS